MFQNILVPIDGSSRSHTVLPYAAELASKFGGRVVLLYVTPDPVNVMAAADGLTYTSSNVAEEYAELRREGDEFLDRAKEALTETQQGLTVEMVQVGLQGRPIADLIAEVALTQHSDLLIMATHGRSGIAHMLMGSVAEATLKKLHIPVLLLRPERPAHK